MSTPRGFATELARLLNTRLARTLSATGLVLVVLSWQLPVLTDRVRWYGADARVYLAATRAMLDGGALYDTTAGGYGFTYPPFAAILLAPSGLLPVDIGVRLIVLSESLGAIVAALITLRAVGVRSRGVVLAGCLVASVIYPSFTAAGIGQVDLVILTAVCCDLFLLRHSRYGGLIVGLCAAVKLTPAVFVLVLLLDRRWRSCVRAFVAAGTATGLALLILPGESRWFWYHGLFDTTRVGLVTAPLNQSLAGLIGRAAAVTGPSLEGAARSAWIVACVLVIGVAALVMRGLSARGEWPTAVSVCALVGLVISPVSWMHHWVWMIVVGAALAALGIRRASWSLVALAVVGTALAFIAPQWINGPYFVMDGVPSWGLGSQLAGSALVVWALLVIGVLGLGSRTASTRLPTAARPAESS